MASADFRFDIRTPREARSQWHQIGSPQVRHTSFLPVHRIYVSDSCMSIGYCDFRFDIRTPREARSQWHQIGSPQVRHTSFLPVHRIYVSDSCMSIGYWVVVPPHPSEPPHIRFLFVEHAFCYRLPPDLVLPLRPCRVANPSPHRAVVVPPHPSEPPHIRFLFVEHAFCYRLPPDLVLPLRPCRVANPSPHRASSGFASYRSAPCWAH